MINELNMKLLRFLVFGIMSVILLPSIIAAEWQWSVQLPSIISNETNDHPQAFLWIPSDCTQLKAVIIGNHNMTEETLFAVTCSLSPALPTGGVKKRTTERLSSSPNHNFG